MYKVYYLSIFGVPFYVGITSHGLDKRFYDHKKECVLPRYYQSRTMDMMSKNIDIVEINELESLECTRKEAMAIERYWIHQFIAWGFDMTNKELRPRRKMTISEKRLIY